MSYQFAFPNMDVSGTLRLHDEVIKIQDTTAWLDRQWRYPTPENSGFDFLGNLPSWLWLGITLNPAQTAALSLGDVCYGNGEHHAFATLLDENGLQSNHVAELDYRDVWQSEQTGNSYPARLHIRIPTADIELTLTAMRDNPEFCHGGGTVNISGCQRRALSWTRHRTHGNSGNDRRLLLSLQKIAPKVRLVFLSIQGREIEKMLEQGELDIAVICHMVAELHALEAQTAEWFGLEKLNQLIKQLQHLQLVFTRQAKLNHGNQSKR
ncbi:MAG: lipocalin family protein [Neisseria sp.]|uniref:lipocalin family protein n=1 Tax=Neisseria sp. TaxID=192066 RepID=UPI0026DCB4FC|nr:lipocalin family protein [Neisseria sp.]MDO4248658.1 lipocalin family protein [Neisseria sp.]